MHVAYSAGEVDAEFNLAEMIACLKREYEDSTNVP
jgi:hypothetical protein